MSGGMAWGAVLGLGMGCGLWLAFVRLPVMRRLRFADRVAPQLRSGRPLPALGASQLAAESPLGPLGRIFGPVLADVVQRINRFNPSSGALEKRLGKAGLDLSVSDFRAEQLLWASGGLLVAGAFVTGSAVNGNFNAFLSLVLLAGLPLCGFALREWYLGEQVQRRSRRILGQFPGIAELMALAVGAGESTIGAMERIGRTTRGDVSDEFRSALAEVRSGRALGDALRHMADRVDLGVMTRFVDALNVASERGTPVAQVMRSQAQDVRDAAKRDLMETAGRKEIGMMLPVVFGILPLTIVFAVYPGIALIDLSY